MDEKKKERQCVDEKDDNDDDDDIDKCSPDRIQLKKCDTIGLFSW
jgi:hypothetical protein